jgi:hypothetical protein
MYGEDYGDGGVTWFITGALIIAAGVLAYLYFSDPTPTKINDGSTPCALKREAR